jgi:DNA-directed RNA polymerase specialized sigma subunit
MTIIADRLTTRLSPQGQERIIRLLFTEGLSADAIAQRFCVTPRHVRRIRAVYMARLQHAKGK